MPWFMAPFERRGCGPFDPVRPNTSLRRAGVRSGTTSGIGDAYRLTIGA
jgi:hypothetical protein